jgi:hypothetical protein
MPKLYKIKTYSPSQSIIRGMARMIDPFGTLNEQFITVEYPEVKSYREAMKADYEAMRSDWEKVGEDLYQAIGNNLQNSK